jgi:sec-independent protein translocase protein TatC
VSVLSGLRGRRRRVVDDEGRMTLVEHLRELRSRLARSALAVAVGAVIGWLAYPRVFRALEAPFTQIQASARAAHRPVPMLVLSQIQDAFNLQVKIALLIGVVIASPVWIYQLWQFVTPGLHRHERRWAAGILLPAVPLFLAGVYVGYRALPRILAFFVDFTPTGVQNLIAVDHYIGYEAQVVLLFGVAFLSPVFLVLLNLVGVLPAARIRSWWRGILFIAIVFAGVAVPTFNPLYQLLVLVPMVVLLLAAYGVCVVFDARKAARETADGYTELADLDDDTPSPSPRASRLEPVEPVTGTDPRGPAGPGDPAGG